MEVVVVDLHGKDAVVEARGMSKCRGCCSMDGRNSGIGNQGEGWRSLWPSWGVVVRGEDWKNLLSPKT